MHIFLSYLLILCCLGNMVVADDYQSKPKKIVALVPGHNDGRFLSNCFRALALYADAIVYLDDASTDDSVAIAERLAKECNIEQIITKKNWVRHASADRNILLNAGRAIGGTHFITIDADEMFTANCLNDTILRSTILNLKQGEHLFLAWIQLWRSTNRYRFDSSVWTHNYKAFAFCDDGVCYHTNAFLNESRTPNTLTGMRWFIEGYQYGVLHFQFVNFDNLLQKQAWYRCMERVYNEKRSIQSINAEYKPSIDETGLQTVECPSEWFMAYPFLDYKATKEKELWRQNDVMAWFATYGLERFAGLDIWNIQWPFNKYIASESCFLDSFVFKQQEKGVAMELGGNHAGSYNPASFFYEQKSWQHVTDFSENTIDLLVIQDRDLLQTYKNKLVNVRVIAFKTDQITQELTEKLYAYDFSLVSYDDNGYSYFLKMR
jgi:glycosyltransferase involved in cell wall biosynthesis